jgi:branched-chain amino acid transport system substrate-binding protein
MSEGKKSSKMAIGTFVVGLLIGLVVMYAAAPSLISSPSSGAMTETVTASGAAASGLSGTITIGDLVALTGDLSAYGQHSKNAIDMAIADVNTWLASTGSTVQFAVTHEDTATDPATCLQKLQTLAAQGIQVYIGPMTSAEVRNVLSYANTNQLVLISQSSTAQDLGNRTNSFLFRLVPTDDAQSKAVARTVYQYGVQDAIVIARHDTWGDGLSAAFEARYTQLGGNIVDTIQYTPVSTGTYDFSAQLTQMQSDYSTAVAKYGAGKVGVVAFAFDELSLIYQQLSSYPALSKTVWFGSDGTADSSTVATTAGSTAASVKSLSTIYAPTRGDKYAAFTSAYVAKYGGTPDAYAYSAYDAAWVAALSILAVGKNSGAAVQKVLNGVANNYYGVAGWPDLNANGDRTIADYDIWEVQATNATSFGWVNVGTWSASSDSVAYTMST